MNNHHKARLRRLGELISQGEYRVESRAVADAIICRASGLGLGLEDFLAEVSTDQVQLGAATDGIISAGRRLRAHTAVAA